MILRSASLARPVMVKLTHQHIAPITRRCLFTPSVVRSADLVQQMYLRELQSYKPTPIKPNDSEGHVQKFSMPKAPATPEEANLANELKEYESQVPEIEGQSASGEAVAVEDWFEEPEEEPEAHH